MILKQRLKGFMEYINVCGDKYPKGEVVIIDVEASSLSKDSYPIEIAWLSLANESDTFLINPDSVSGWTDWSIESQAIHNIERNTLVAHGINAFDAANRLNSMLAGCLVISDYAGSDGNWLSVLFKRVGVKMLFSVIDMLEIACAEERIKNWAEFKAAKRTAVVKHRALADCEQNLSIYLSVGLL